MVEWKQQKGHWMKVSLSFENHKLYVMKYDSCVNVNAFVKAAGFSALVFSAL